MTSDIFVNAASNIYNKEDKLKYFNLEDDLK